MVGAGIFALLGEAGAVAGAAVWLSFLLAGIVAGLLGYTVVKLGVCFPSSGGLIAYLVEGFGNGRLVGIASWLGYPPPGQKAASPMEDPRRTSPTGTVRRVLMRIASPLSALFALARALSPPSAPQPATPIAVTARAAANQGPRRLSMYGTRRSLMPEASARLGAGAMGAEGPTRTRRD